jgi:hypothetical protein
LDPFEFGKTLFLLFGADLLKLDGLLGDSPIVLLDDLVEPLLGLDLLPNLDLLERNKKNEYSTL